MSVTFTEQDLLFVKAEYERFLADYDDGLFRQSCESNSRLLIKGYKDAAHYVVQQALEALGTSSPLSMIRIGDGEGNVLGLLASDDDKELKWFNAIFYVQDAQLLPMAAAKSFSQELLFAANDADIIGFRAFHPVQDTSEIQAIRRTIDRGDVRGALGIIRASQFAKSAVESCVFQNAVITSAWVYLGLLEHLDRLLENASSVIIITGRPELEAVFVEKLKKRLTAFLAVPIEMTAQTLPDRPFHYPKRFEEIIEALQTDLRGSLVLVGAGIFGKIYCATAKRSGAVALDLGSGFDILAGKFTRPIHGRPGLVDLDKLAWIKAKSC